MAITPTEVITWLDLKSTQPADPILVSVVATVNAYVAGLPVLANLPATVEPPGPWPPDVHLGAVMLAARLWRRRNSPGGVEAITESGATYIARNDIDIARLLRIDGLIRPAVG